MAVMCAPELSPAEDPPREIEQAWELLVSQGYHAEIVNGRIIVSPAPAFRHIKAVDRLAKQLHEIARDRDWCLAFGGAVHIPDTRGRRLPDLAVVPDDAPLYDEAQVHGHGVLLAVEVVSPGKDARREDFLTKAEEYAGAGVPLYLIIDPEVEPQTVTLMSDPKDGEYTARTDVTAGDPLHLPAPFDLTVDTKKLFA
jgi:Uma2 family endonuclease